MQSAHQAHVAEVHCYWVKCMEPLSPLRKQPVCHHQVRIEQVLISGPPLLLCFKLGQLLAFYRDTVEVCIVVSVSTTHAIWGSRLHATTWLLIHACMSQGGRSDVPHSRCAPRLESVPNHACAYGCTAGCSAVHLPVHCSAGCDCKGVAMQGVLGEAASLSATLRGCRALAQRSFQEQLQSAGAQLLRYPPQPPRDLSPPPQVRTPSLLAD